MSNITVDDAEILSKLKELQQKIPEQTKEALDRVCKKIEADSKQNCPAGTGMLRESITSGIEETAEGINGYIGSNLEYAPYVHQGTGLFAADGNGRKDVPWTYYDAKSGKYVKTSGIHPSPFIMDAVDANRDAILSYFEGLLK